jgi:hypothetical protein
MLLREVHGERTRAVDPRIPKMLGKQTTIDQDDTVMSLLLDLTIHPSSTPDILTVLHDRPLAQTPAS